MLRTLVRLSRSPRGEFRDLCTSAASRCSSTTEATTSGRPSSDGAHYSHTGSASTEDIPAKPAKRRRRQPSLVDRLQKQFATDEDAEQANQKVIGAAVIERYPIVFPTLPDWQLDYLLWQRDWNAWKYKQLPENYINCDKDVDETSESATFEPEPIETEADRENDVRSLRRKTPGHLYLLLCDKDGNWAFPQAVNTSTETLRETVQRSLRETVASSIEAEVLGNTPSAHIAHGDANMFFMLGLVLDGNVRLKPRGESSGMVDYAWLTKEEILAKFSNDESLTNMLQTLLE